MNIHSLKNGLLVALAASAALLPLSPARAQSSQGLDHGAIFIPDTSVEQPGDRGNKAHTNHLIRIMPANGLGPNGGMSPDQIRAAYVLPSAGGSGVIAIVDAYDYPTATNDFNVFSKQFNLPQETGDKTHFQVVYAGNKKPRGNGGWNQEAALDIEWAHAMAPSAKIVLVEAASASFSDLFAAVDKASTLAGVKQVSMSWGGSEFSSEASYDSHFPQNNGIVYFASSGDTGGVTEYPGVSPNVVSAGGTNLQMSDLSFVGETGWSGTGGGPSKYEARPAYQNGIASIVGTQRGVPDFSFDADPYTGVSVYDSTPYQGQSGWMVFGGTSVSSPSLAGIVNIGGSMYTSSVAELTTIYQNLGTSNFRDILSGTAGGNTAAAGWDFVTGVGSNQGTAGK